jgi:hypothetical protein
LALERKRLKGKRNTEPPLAISQPAAGVDVMKNPKEKRQHERVSIDALYEKRDRALQRVLDLCQKDGTSMDMEEAEELNKAPDVLAVAHTMVVFEFAGGSFSS